MSTMFTRSRRVWDTKSKSYIRADATIEIDVEKIADKMIAKAYGATSNRSKLLHGAIKVTIKETDQ